MAAPWTVEEDGVRVTVRVTPRAARDALDGVGALSDGRPVVLARIRAVPEKGAANAALERLLAEAVGVPPARVSVVAGGRARLKTLRIAGDGPAVAAALGRLARET